MQNFPLAGAEKDQATFGWAHHCMGSGKSNDYQNHMAAQEMEGVSGIFEQSFSCLCCKVSTYCQPEGVVPAI
jgi:hypothetical protein